MFGIGVPELIIILVIALILFGPGKLPDVGKSIGKSISEFKKASKDITDEVTKATSEVTQVTKDTAKTLKDATNVTDEVTKVSKKS